MAVDSPPRSKTPQTTQSFSRMEDASPGAHRTRAKTVHGVMSPELVTSTSPLLPLEPEPIADGADVFEKRDSTDSGEGNPIEQAGPAIVQSQNITDQFELPIELVSLTDRFVASLTAKVYSTPPSIDKLSELFQDFYVRASAPISTHVSTLASRLNRQISSSPSRSQTLDNVGQKNGRKGDGKPASTQQMLTAEEVSEKRKARKLLQYKRHALEEAVERRACETIYEKIWRHRSTLDEVRDEKLRSKTAALSLVGIGLKDLGIDMWDLDGDKGTEASDYLNSARESLMKMNDEKYPLGKLQHLTAAHKAIVDTLTKVLPSSSSADEILPTLIYTLITTPPEGINIISNLLFIQRFRASSKLDGESAYCLTNLEAAISFLENVDLSDLRADEAQNGNDKRAVGVSSPISIQSDPLGTDVSKSSAGAATTLQATSSRTRKSEPSSRLASADSGQKFAALEPSPQRRLTDLLQPSAKALGAANDAVRTTADQGFKNISNTLDNSFKFLFGRLKEVQINQNGDSHGGAGIVPKTLDDARRLVNTSPIIDDGSNPDDDPSSKEQSSRTAQSGLGVKQDDRLLGLIGGRKTSRQHSDDSVSSSGTILKGLSTTAENSTPTSAPNMPFGSMKSFGNTLNPLNHIPGMIRGLGRSPPDPSQGLQISTDKSKTTDAISSRSSTPVPQKYNISSTDFKPPIKRFVEMQNSGELRLSDIPELLEDYKRLASIFAEHAAT
ncbi:hypothetical protein FQN52_004289 [Onygenales sp. PD_12]|nr:hypothetical protein FQN52_004289 [Onygenales sp. PD_12]KAK2800322.1 hypothetical protein FQN51_006230 [Onygenales sp. PD_10]